MAIALSNPGATRVTIEGVDVGTVVGRGFDGVNRTPGAVGRTVTFLAVKRGI